VKNTGCINNMSKIYNKWKKSTCKAFAEEIVVAYPACLDIVLKLLKL
jgi:hypothetical protein